MWHLQCKLLCVVKILHIIARSVPYKHPKPSLPTVYSIPSIEPPYMGLCFDSNTYLHDI